MMSPAPDAGAASEEISIPHGIYKPFFREEGERDREVGPLLFDKDAVSNEDFLQFVRARPEWRKSKVKPIFASGSYLEHWTADEAYPVSAAHQPVTNVSWFAARKYCEWKGKRLPTVAEWEFAADGASKKNVELILSWYEHTGEPLTDVSKTAANTYGLRGMHGNVWEWVEDFSSVIVQGDSRNSNDAAGQLFCGSGSLRAKDPTQYATFMRFAHRSSLKANYVGGTLGFRCVK